jgi:hypothetical protein
VVEVEAVVGYEKVEEGRRIQQVVMMVYCCCYWWSRSLVEPTKAEQEEQTQKMYAE